MTRLTVIHGRLLPTKRRRQPESEIHEAVIAQLRKRAYPDVRFWHTPNSGKLTIRQAARMKRLGVLAGVSDLLIVRQKTEMLYALELKAAGRTPTEEQLAFIDFLRDAGFCAAWVQGVDAAVRCLETWEVIRPDRSVIRRAA